MHYGTRNDDLWSESLEFFIRRPALSNILYWIYHRSQAVRKMKKRYLVVELSMHKVLELVSRVEVKQRELLSNHSHPKRTYAVWQPSVILCISFVLLQTRYQYFFMFHKNSRKGLSPSITRLEEKWSLWLPQTFVLFCFINLADTQTVHFANRSNGSHISSYSAFFPLCGTHQGHRGPHAYQHWNGR